MSAAGAARVLVCGGSGCRSAGAERVHAACAAAAPAGTRVLLTGCQGFCQGGPLVALEPAGVLLQRVRPEDAAEALAGAPPERLLPAGADGAPCARRAELPFYQGQHRLLLAAVGEGDPLDLGAARARGVYRQAERAWTALEPAAIIAAMAEAGLRGRGGGGFPTARKWALAAGRAAARKVLICNADEGDPGAFMNRALLFGDPHAVLDGMLIAARAIGADLGLIYIRAEHRAVVERVRRAIADAEAAGLLGDAPFACGRRFHVEVAEGASAFVCGEETALIASLEGRRGCPAPRPPWPAESGLHGRPTVVNNVETLAAAAQVLRLGPAAYRALGSAGSGGTKILTLTGHLARTGLAEVRLGTSLRDIVYGIGGGPAPGSQAIKAVLVGGPSGGIIPGDALDIPFDYEPLAAAGAMVGSGFIAAMDERTCMVDVARFFAEFAAQETCGKCVPCREGTRQMLALLDGMRAGRGGGEALALVEELAETMSFASLCGLGRTAANPVVTALRRFPREFAAHARDARCPARRCKALTPPEVDAAACKGCGACLRACPAGAVSGDRRQAHRIDPARCIRCGACITACKFKAVA